MKKMEQLYEGKAKKVFKTDDENLYIVDYKDDATAFNGLKKGQIAAGSFSKRFGVEEGKKLNCTTLEYCLKNDDLGDPMINDYQIIAIGAATKEDLDTIADLTFKVNDVLKAYFESINIELVDFKIEFGKTPDGQIILADEISPDTCRLWDATTHEKLDKDRFRRDMGNVEEAYAEVFKRLGL